MSAYSAGHNFTVVYNTSRCGLLMLQIMFNNIASRKTQVSSCFHNALYEPHLTSGCSTKLYIVCRNRCVRATRYTCRLYVCIIVYVIMNVHLFMFYFPVLYMSLLVCYPVCKIPSGHVHQLVTRSPANSD